MRQKAAEINSQAGLLPVIRISLRAQYAAASWTDAAATDSKMAR